MPSDILYPNISEANGFAMEEQERKEEGKGRWREMRDCGTDGGATIPVGKHWNHHRVTTKAILEGARDILSDNSVKMNGVTPNGDGEVDNVQCNNQVNNSDEKPSKLFVNMNQSDKASQMPEPFPYSDDDIELKNLDEPDGEPEQEKNCAVDCLYVTLQCCDCSLM